MAQEHGWENFTYHTTDPPSNTDKNEASPGRTMQLGMSVLPAAPVLP